MAEGDLRRAVVVGASDASPSAASAVVGGPRGTALETKAIMDAPIGSVTKAEAWVQAGLGGDGGVATPCRWPLPADGHSPPAPSRV